MTRTAIATPDAPSAIGPYSQAIRHGEAYGAFFGAAPPARVTIGVAALPKGAHVEIDALVALS